jgi:hypothetical protein
MKIHAIQLNFNDYNSSIYGRPDTLVHQFYIEASNDGNNWEIIADYSKNNKDQPHAYIELETPVNFQFVRYRNQYISQEFLSLSEFRVFGKAEGQAPKSITNFKAKRQSDERNATLQWDVNTSAKGYVIYWGIHPDKMNNSLMVYENNYELRALNVDQKYYVTIEAFNESGISKVIKPVEI